MVEALTMVSSVVPSLLLLWYFQTRDVFPEPSRVIWATFGLGAFAIVPVCIVGFPIDAALQAVVGGQPLLYGFGKAFFVAALPEEGFKLLVLMAYAGRHSAFDEPMDGLVYGAAASLGFATLENVLYVSEGGPVIAVMRALSAVPMHACCGALMGYFYGRARYGVSRGRSLALAYFVPVAFHGVYDFPLLTLGELTGGGGQPPPVLALSFLCLGMVVLGAVVVTSVVVVRRARREQGLRGAPLPNPPEPPPTATLGSGLTGALLVASGGLFAAVGGTLALAITLLAVSGSGPFGSLMLGAVLFGLLPAGIGSGGFAMGIRLLNRRADTVRP